MRLLALTALPAALLVMFPLLPGSASQAPAAASVWDGVYTAGQAQRGADLYAKTCKSCHGAQLEGEGQAPPLSGDEFTGNWEKQTVDDLFEIVQTTMPADKPGSLTRTQNADILAYIFQANQFPGGKTELPSDPETLKKIQIEAKK